MYSNRKSNDTKKHYYTFFFFKKHGGKYLQIEERGKSVESSCLWGAGVRGGESGPRDPERYTLSDM